MNMSEEKKREDVDLETEREQIEPVVLKKHSRRVAEEEILMGQPEEEKKEVEQTKEAQVP